MKSVPTNASATALLNAVVAALLRMMTSPATFARISGVSHQSSPATARVHSAMLTLNEKIQTTTSRTARRRNGRSAGGASDINFVAPDDVMSSLTALPLDWHWV